MTVRWTDNQTDNSDRGGQTDTQADEWETEKQNGSEMFMLMRQHGSALLGIQSQLQL